MYKVILKTFIVLSMLFNLSLFQNGAVASEETPIPTTEPNKLTGLRITSGGFASTLTDESYPVRDKKIMMGAKDDYAISIGSLVHVPLPWQTRFHNINSAIGISGGFAFDAETPRNGKIVLDGQLALGISLLFNSGNSLFALTFGQHIRPVERLDGYNVGDLLKGNEMNLNNTMAPIKSIYKRGWFLAITTNFGFINPFGAKEAKDSADKANKK